jgi:PIN domain nuclease of toxin-antitoxin system
MNLLLDTHILLWWLADAPELPKEASRLIQDTNNLVFISAATIWEIAIKRSLGKLEIPGDYVQSLVREGFRELPVTWEHARHSEELPTIHPDPFDRLLVSQAQTEDLILVTTDANIRKYDVPLAAV